MRLRGSRAILLILFVALVVRVGVIVVTPDFQPIFDASHYDRIAASIAAGGPFFGQYDPPPEPSAFRPPLYPVALAAVHFVGGGWTGGRLLGALFGVATVLLVFLVAERLWSRRVALVAAALTAVFPPLVLLNASLLSEALFVPLVLAVLLAILNYREEHRLAWAVAAGVLCGLAALTRVNGLLLIVAAAAGAWTLRPRWRREALVAPVVVVVAAVLTVTPWVIRNTVAFERFVGISTQGGYAIAATYNGESARIEPPGRPLQTHTVAEFRDLYRGPNLDEGERSSQLTARGIDFALDNPRYVAGTLVWNTLRVFDVYRDLSFERAFPGSYLQALRVPALVSPLVPATVFLMVALALAGAVMQARIAGARRAPGFVWLFPALMVLPAIAVYGLARYRAPLDPFLVMLAAVALVSLFDRVKARRSKALTRADAADKS